MLVPFSYPSLSILLKLSNNRYYDPETDQFLSVDPMVETTGQPYVFANDNPLNATDPIGIIPVASTQETNKQQDALASAYVSSQIESLTDYASSQLRSDMKRARKLLQEEENLYYQLRSADINGGVNSYLERQAKEIGLLLAGTLSQLNYIAGVASSYYNVIQAKGFITSISNSISSTESQIANASAEDAEILSGQLTELRSSMVEAYANLGSSWVDFWVSVFGGDAA